MYFKNLPNVSKNLPNVSKNLTHIYVIVRMYPSRNTLFGKKKEISLNRGPFCMPSKIMTSQKRLPYY